MSKLNFIVFLVLFLFKISCLLAQSSSFKEFDKKANALKLSHSINLSKDSLPINTDSLLIRLYKKNNWKAEDLFILDSLETKLAENKNPFKKAIYNQIASNAYRFFDISISDSLAYEAFNFYKKNNDVDGMVFSGSYILDNAYTINHSEESNTTKILFNELVSTKSKTNYIPSQLCIADIWLDFHQKNNIQVKPIQIDSLYNAFKSSERAYPILVCNLYAGLFVHSIRNNLNERVMKFAKLSFQLAADKTPTYSYGVFVYNLGYAHQLNNQPDSAIYYCHKALKYLKVNEGAYSMLVITFVYRRLASIYYEQKEIDSLYKYSNLYNKYKEKQTNAQLEQKRIYAEKKFETLQYNLRSKFLENQLAIKEKENKVYLSITILATLFVIALFYLFFKRRELIKKTKDYAHSREQLLQIISHDLTGSIDALVSFVKIFEDAKKTLPSKEFKNLENQFIASSKSIQLTLKDITYWGRGLRNKLTTKDVRFNFDEFLNHIINTYRAFARTKNLNINTKYNVGVITIVPQDLAVLLRNLINNAIKHSKPNTSIKISASCYKNRLKFEICNTAKPKEIKELQKIITAINLKRYKAKSNLGFELINTALLRLKGNININANEGDEYNAIISVEIPLL